MPEVPQKKNKPPESSISVSTKSVPCIVLCCRPWADQPHTLWNVPFSKSKPSRFPYSPFFPSPIFAAKKTPKKLRIIGRTLEGVKDSVFAWLVRFGYIQTTSDLRFHGFLGNKHPDHSLRKSRHGRWLPIISSWAPNCEGAQVEGSCGVPVGGWLVKGW